MRTRLCIAGLTVLSTLLVACSDTRSSAPAAKGRVGGTIVLSSSGDADVLFPPLTMTLQGKQVVDQVFDNLADIGPTLNTVGDAGAIFFSRCAGRMTTGLAALKNASGVR